LKVDVHDVPLTEENAPAILSGYDVVLDGTDNFPTRYVVNDACAALGIPLVWGSVLGFDAQVSVFWSRPPGRPAVDLRDLFPEPPGPEDASSCALAGVLGALCGQAGSIMATEAVKLVTGIGEPLLGRVLVLDALAARWREVPLRSAGSSEATGPGAPAARRAPRVAPRPGDERGMGADELVARLSAGDRLTVLDVREAAERSAGEIAGAIHVPLADLFEPGAVAALPDASPLVVYCAGGTRSADAVRLLRAAGRPDAIHLDGGYAAWRVAWSTSGDAAPRRTASSGADGPGPRARLAP
jgi:adenylyltransferase/sulfurtransferase